MTKRFMPVALAIAVVLSAGARTASAEPFILGFTNFHENVVLALNGGTLLFNTSDSQIDAGINNSGWWSDTVGNDNSDANDNYIVGSVDGLGNFHNFFTFDLSNLGVVVTDAELRITRGNTDCPSNDTSNGPCVGPDPFGSVEYTLWDVSTDYLTLNANDGTSGAIYLDLGSGTSYGSVSVSDDGSPDPLVVALNGDAITAINRNAGEFFSIGGALPGQVPEPASMALLLLGGGAAAFRARRRRAS